MFNIFGNSNNSGNNSGNKQPQQQQPQQQSNNPDPNVDPKPEPQGLDKFNHLLQTNTNKDGQAANGQQAREPLNVPELFKNQEFMSNLKSNLRQSITSSISPETRQKLESNDPSAMMDLVSEVAEASYLQALQHGASLQNLVMDDRFNEFNTQTNDLVNSRLQNQEFTQAIPQLKNPIVQLGVESFMSKVREQNPSITPEDMKEQLTGYLSELGKSFGAIPEEEQNSGKEDQGIDWMAELGMESQEPQGS